MAKYGSDSFLKEFFGSRYKWNVAVSVLFLAALSSLIMGFGYAQAASRPGSFADLAERLKPSVVNVSTAQSFSHPGPMGERPQAPPGSPFEEFFRDFFERQEQDGTQGPRRRKQSLGSGFLISSEGIVVTNNHVIADADEIAVTLDDKRTYSARIIGRDVKTDLAVLRIENSKGEKFPYVSWGNSDESRVGDWVIAIGNPFGLGGSVTAGIISARGRNINAGPYDNFIQTDASINRGNSGGPMFDLEGHVIGINTAIFSPSGGSVGIGFAIPANLAKRVVAQLVEFGRTQRGWLGVQIQTVNEEIAESLALGDPRGALISRVNEGGPAKKAGLQVGDVILEFGGKPVLEMRQLPRIVADTKIGTRVKVVVWRKGKKEYLDVVVGELEEGARKITTGQVTKPPTGEVLGMQLAELTAENRSKFDLRAEVQGVLVTKVAGDSLAATRGIRAGDVIIEVNQEVVENPAGVSAKISSVKTAGRKSALLLIDRNGDLRFVAIRIDE